MKETKIDFHFLVFLMLECFLVNRLKEFLLVLLIEESEGDSNEGRLVAFLSLFRAYFGIYFRLFPFMKIIMFDVYDGFFIARFWMILLEYNFFILWLIVIIYDIHL